MGRQNIQNSKVTWKVNDLCGTAAEKESEFQVVDRKAPIPYCVSFLPIIFSYTENNFLIAKDYDKGAFDNCTSRSEWMFSFNHLPPVRNLAKHNHYFKLSDSPQESIEATEEEFEMGLAYFWDASLKICSNVCLSGNYLLPYLNYCF